MKMIYPCPACTQPSIYSKSLDRYLHQDGSSNLACWKKITRGEGNPTVRTTLWIDPLEVRCPWCDADPGDLCTGRKDLHAPRVDKAIRLHREIQSAVGV